MPHNFIRITAGTPNPGHRKPDDVKNVCKKHGGTLQCLLFDAHTQPEFAFVLVKNGNVDAIRAELGGGETLFQYFEADEVG